MNEEAKIKIPVFEVEKKEPVSYLTWEYAAMFKFYIDDEVDGKPCVVGVVLANTKEEALEKVSHEYSSSGCVPANISIESVKFITPDIYEVETY
jgi:hypothetical protein